ncbi:WD40/YVTN/BNR-like repeat-containing protein [Haladaptatus sp. DFWS20]|uniref:WD40/YVTN/BNR-like repeat-containing protein n=1 Tax=Haladaptatus sp. DFWS20 TaxID=3403467 RepID=UPI003EC13DCC
MTSFASSRGFVPFYRRYTKTWIHALATAGLTAFGMLTFAHRGFAVVAVAVYVLPPIVLYFRGADVSGVESSTDKIGKSDTIPDSKSNPDTTASVDTSDEAAAAKDSNEPTETTPAKKPHWTTADTPTDKTLFDAVTTDVGAYAVGEDGVVLADDETSDSEWRVLLSDGPGAGGNTLRGADTTEGGGSVWFAGDSGSLGRLDTETGRHTDYSAPSGITDNWTDIAVSGTDDAAILLVNGSGQVLRGRYRDSDLAWDGSTKPGSGSSLCAVTFVDRSVGYCCDTNDSVFETTDGGETFRKIGVGGVNGTLTDIAAIARSDCAVTDDDGVLHGHADGNWTPTRLGDDPLRALARDDEQAVVCGANGVVYERGRADSTAEWERIVTTANELRGVTIDSNRGIAVGAGGTIVERVMPKSQGKPDDQ